MSDLATVFVVDDDPAARRSVAAIVESMGAEAEVYESAERFLQSYDRLRPGCLVTDMRMSGMNGLELQEKLQDEGAPLPVIVITAYAEVPIAVRAMKNGALTLLEKPCRQDELWEAVRDGLQLAAKAFPQEAFRREARERLSSLTQDELDVLEAVIAGKSNKAAASHLGVGLRTVEKRRHNVFEKMNVSSISELVRVTMAARSDGASCQCLSPPSQPGDEDSAGNAPDLPPVTE